MQQLSEVVTCSDVFGTALSVSGALDPNHEWCSVSGAVDPNHEWRPRSVASGSHKHSCAVGHAVSAMLS